MKNLFYALLPLIIVACSQKDNNTTVTISGTIENPVGDHIFIKGSKEITSGVVDSILVDRGGNFVVGFAIVDMDRNFAMSFEIDKSGYFRFYHGREHTDLFLAPGDSMHISLDTEEFDETIHYSGRGSVVNNFLVEKYLLAEEISINRKKLYSLEVEQFIARTDSVKNVMEENLSEFLNSKQDVLEKFKKFEYANILYTWIAKRLSYSKSHKYYAEKDSVDLGENYDDYLSQIVMNDVDLLASGFYRSTLKSYLSKKADEEIEKDSSLKELDNYLTTIKLRLTKELFSDEKVRNFMLYSVIHQQLISSGTYKTEALIADFESNCTNQEYITNIKKEIRKWGILAEGNPAPLFAFPDINGDTVSLGDFKGKYVYVDVWATWCGPCKKEIPHLEKLQEEFKNKNIVFISISVDNTKTPWEKMVKEKNMKGIQLFAQGWQSTIVKDYKIRGIPRFMLIDPDGNIINVKAPRPSKNIKEILEKLEGIQT